jgi:hypothetical protein
MSASSVTGKGVGAADSGVKGAGSNRNYFVPDVNPHVVCADHVTISGVTTVTFPSPLPGTKTNYVVILTPLVSNGNDTYVSTKTDNGAGDFASFAITGANGTCAWMVVMRGFGF